MRVGDLVILNLGKDDYEWVGVVVKTDKDWKYGRIYYVAFTDGDTEWCLEEDLEVICK